MQISARNQITGIVEAIEIGTVNAEVHIKLKSNNILVSIITNTAVQNLDLKVGDEVVAIIKSSNVFISTDENLQLSARNKFQGIVDSINQGGINSEIVIDIGNGDKIVAIITTSSVNSLNIKEKSKVGAIIKASDVMIGR